MSSNSADEEGGGYAPEESALSNVEEGPLPAEAAEPQSVDASMRSSVLYPATDNEEFQQLFSERETSSKHMSVPRRTALQMNKGVSAVATSFYDLSYHPGRVRLYSPIRQRQKWGDNQVLPRVNWGDLFFDLFFVGLSYNVSYILTNSPDKQGLLYAAGTFLVAMSTWTEKMSFDARFVSEDDLFHRCYQIAMLVVLATLVLHTRPVKILSDTSQESMFVFALCLCIDKVLVILRNVEIYYYGLGQKAMKKSAISMMQFNALVLMIYVVAAGIAGANFYGDEEKATGDYNGTTRLLAEAADESSSYKEKETSNVPMLLILFGHVGYMAFMVIRVTCFFPGGGKHKERVVPVNVSFTIHRTGEWIMLMLGESLFSILIVDVPNEDKHFRSTFYAALLTVAFLQFLHFKSEPHDPNHHAIRRHKNAGMWWMVFFQIYSLALVSLGASFTLFLEYYGSTYGGKGSRRLAGSGDYASTKTQAAHLYCGTLAVLLGCLLAMSLLHVGLAEGKKRCYCTETKRKNLMGYIIILARLGLLVFVATLSQYQTEPDKLASEGLAVIILELALRKMGNKYLSHKEVGVLQEEPHENEH